MRGEPNDFYSRSCDLAGHEWGEHEAGARCIWCGTYQLYLTNAIKAERAALITTLREGVMGLQRRDQISTHGKGLKFHAMQPDSDGKYVFYSDVLALLEKEGE